MVDVVLIYPPVAKPCEPPAGIARLAGALRGAGASCEVIDADIQGFDDLMGRSAPAPDTWSRRAHRHRYRHIGTLRTVASYRQPDRYGRAVADLGRVLAVAGEPLGIHAGLADYHDAQWAPVRSADLLSAADQPERTLYYGYYRERLIPRILDLEPQWVGVSICYLSQALCAFALIGMLKRARPGLPVFIGGGLVTSWMRRPGGAPAFDGLVDRMVAGPGEAMLLGAMGIGELPAEYAPDYSDLVSENYLSPGFVLPFSASDGCWWRRCAFCPERAEGRPYRPLPKKTAARQLRRLAEQTGPALIHLLDNAVSPALLKALAADPPGAPWYGFARFAPPLDDPEVCRRLAASGCVMLQLGLESGSQRVLDRLGKGTSLDMASQVLRNLARVGIGTYVYLLFGTPAEEEAEAQKTLTFVVDHRSAVGFLNVAIFNLPIGSPDARVLPLHDFYEGDLALYRDFEHPRGWDRAAVRRFLDGRFKKDPAVRAVLRRDPPIFTSNHAAFVVLANGGVPLSAS